MVQCVVQLGIIIESEKAQVPGVVRWVTPGSAAVMLLLTVAVVTPANVDM